MYFKTFASLDIETTSLSFAKICEIAIVACERSHCEEGNGVLPRVQHKLVICINPASKIHPNTTDLTGLDNEALMNVSSFNDTVMDMIDGFLSRLPQPVCLVAHNGFKFDFPILKKEMKNCGEVDMSNIFCADSLPAFREIFPNQKLKKLNLPAELSCSIEDRLCYEAAEKVEKQLALKDINETTPDRRIDALLLAPKKPKYTNPPRMDPSTAIRRLSFSQSTKDAVETTQNSQIAFPLQIHFNCRGTLERYTLPHIYEYLFGFKMTDAHRAEADAMALLECIVKASAIFHWIDKHAVPLSEIGV